jgi:hypothetical protein
MKKLFLILFLIFLTMPFVLFAAEANIEPINPNLPYVKDATSPIGIIGGFYRFALAISGFLAIAVIVYGAIKYATNAGNAGNLADAKEWIYSALLGILLLAGAYILLYTIGGTQLTVLRLPTLTPTSTPGPTITSTTVYAVVEQKIVDTNFASENDCKTVCTGSGKSCVKNKDNSLWSCVENTALPNIQCSKTLNDCNAKKVQLSQQNPSKYYDCVTVYSNKDAWCSSVGLVSPPAGPGTWSYDSIVTGNITPAMFNANPGNLCPKYSSVDTTQFWLSLVKSISKVESGWNPLSQYTETELGIDPITGKTVVSEGLLQLSYQDAKTYKNSVSDCGRIDWAHDKDRPIIEHTILNPDINLSCGMGIMDYWLKKDSNVVSALGHYWSTIRPGQDQNLRNELRQEIPACY